jgi:O-antigen ligase
LLIKTNPKTYQPLPDIDTEHQRIRIMLHTKRPFNLTPLQINVISLLIVSAIAALLLTAAIGHRDDSLGLYIIGGLGAMALAVAIFFKPWLGTYILAITIFTNVSTVLTDQGLPGVNKPLVAITFVATMASYFSTRNRQTIHLKPVEWMTLAFGGVWLASYFVAQDRYVSFEEITEFAKSFVILLVVIFSLRSQTDWKRVIWLVILSATFLAALGTYQAITGNYAQTFGGFAIVTPDVTQMRLSGAVGDPNFHGQILASVLPLALYRLLDEKSLMLKIVGGSSALILVFAILNSYSRGAFLAMVLILLLIAIERRVKPSLIITVVLASLVMMQFLPQGYTERIETLSIFTSEDASIHSEGSFRGRTSEMLAGMLMFTEHPLLGVGIGNYETNYQDYAVVLGLEQRTEDRQAHSLYLEIAAETGLPGLLTMALLFITLMVGLARSRQKSRRIDAKSDWPTWLTALQMSLTSYLVTSIFLHGDFIRYLFFLVALGAAAIHITAQLEESPQPALTSEGAV